jgi:hypothetical protein
MGKILTDNLAPGMMLASDVLDRSGRMLLKTGTELTGRHLYILRTWGIIEADIVGAEDNFADAAPDKSIDPMLWSTLEDKIMPLFLHADLSHPAMYGLLRMRIQREARNGNH